METREHMTDEHIGADLRDESTIARKIVAHLAVRYRIARESAKHSYGAVWQQLWDQEMEAWNAYISARNILQGRKP